MNWNRNLIVFRYVLSFFFKADLKLLCFSDLESLFSKSFLLFSL